MKTLLVVLFVTACTSSSAPGAPSATATSAPPRPSASADRVQVNVTLSGSRPMADVVRDLEQRGLVVEHRLEHIDVVTGTVPRDRMDALRGVSSVTIVEINPEFTVQ